MNEERHICVALFLLLTERKWRTVADQVPPGATTQGKHEIGEDARAGKTIYQYKDEEDSQ